MLRRLHRTPRVMPGLRVRSFFFPLSRQARDLTAAFLSSQLASSYAPTDTFARRHIGPRDHELPEMLKTVGFSSMDEFVKAVVPETVRFPEARPVRGLTETGLGEQEVSGRRRRKKRVGS